MQLYVLLWKLCIGCLMFYCMIPNVFLFHIFHVRKIYQFIKHTIILVIWRYAQIIRKHSYVICYFIGKEDRLFSRQIAVICAANVIQTGSFVFWRIQKLRWDASFEVREFRNIKWVPNAHQSIKNVLNYSLKPKLRCYITQYFLRLLECHLE